MSATDSAGVLDGLVEAATAAFRVLPEPLDARDHSPNAIIYRNLASALSARPTPKADAIKPFCLMCSDHSRIAPPCWRTDCAGSPNYTPNPTDDTTYAGSEVPRDRFANDAAAKIIYDSWSGVEGWVPWVERGNSDKQEEARAALAKDSTS